MRSYKDNLKKLKYKNLYASTEADKNMFKIIKLSLMMALNERCPNA